MKHIALAKHQPSASSAANRELFFEPGALKSYNKISKEQRNRRNKLDGIHSDGVVK